FYLGNTLQFFLINCLCVLLYAACRNTDEEISASIFVGYSFYAASFLIYAVTKETLALRYGGVSVLAMRHHILDHANTLGILYVLLSAYLIHFFPKVRSRSSRVSLIIALVLLALFEFLTYSRSGWISYLVFLLLYAYRWARTKTIQR